jgi:hypothetical protein
MCTQIGGRSRHRGVSKESFPYSLLACVMPSTP